MTLLTLNSRFGRAGTRTTNPPIVVRCATTELSPHLYVDINGSYFVLLPHILWNQDTILRIKDTNLIQPLSETIPNLTCRLVHPNNWTIFSSLLHLSYMGGGGLLERGLIQNFRSEGRDSLERVSYESGGVNTALVVFFIDIDVIYKTIHLILL